MNAQLEISYAEIDREITDLGELLLRRYTASTGEQGFEILLDGAFLMASHGCHSERAMAALAYQRRAGVPRDLVALVGGLGAGHTLRATLDLPGVVRVVVAEIGARVVQWNRLFFADVNGNAVADPRVQVQINDVAQVLAANRRTFDLILLDVDNGPGWLAAEANAGLYRPSGLEACRDALRPGGVLAVWSPKPNPIFFHDFAKVFADAEAVDTNELDPESNEPGSTVYLGSTGP